jgi:upstream activation factor subunit UAF30
MTQKKTTPETEVSSTEVVSDVSTVDKFTSVLEKLQHFASDVKECIAVVKGLQKEFVKLQKSSVKKAKKAPAAAGTRALSGFAKPSLISDQLCEFIGVEKGSSLSRTEVTRKINEYIKANNLQDASDKRKILPDEKLKTILNIVDGEQTNYFNLQKQLKHHFTKAE